MFKMVVFVKPDVLTPLHKTAMHDQADIVKCLLKHGADMFALTKVLLVDFH